MHCRDVVAIWQAHAVWEETAERFEHDYLDTAERLNALRRSDKQVPHAVGGGDSNSDGSGKDED